jgi:4-hydroxybenzoyl-CoA thioesterase
MSKAQMLRHYDIIGCPMVDTRARFLRPSTFGDEVTIETSVSELRRSSFDVRHRLLKADELAVEGFETRVWTGHDRTNLGRLKSRLIPAEVAAALATAE